jgi:fatty acid desaturase
MPESSAGAAKPRGRRGGWFWAHSPWDVIPAVCGVAHLAFVPFLFWAFGRLSWWALVPLGFVAAVAVSWNINGVSHNFLHNRFFRWGWLNQAFSLVESLAVGFSQVFYEAVHRRHHMGNADLPDETGRTVDPLSIYKHGHDGHPENPWTYVFCGYFRDDPGEIYRDVRRLRGRFQAGWGVFEIAAFIAMYVAMGVANWHFIVYWLPCYYLGHCLSYLNGYYLHYGGNPDVPMAWGVSSYHRLYNWLWFNNGYHAEHHFRPKTHWTRMKALHAEIAERQRAAGVRVIRPPHALGFLDPDLPAWGERAAAPETAAKHTDGAA